MLLSYIGLFGLMAYNVARRKGEIGIRMALGAGPGDVARPIVREALLLAAAGLAAGVPVALARAQIIRGALYRVQPYDPATMLGSSVILLVIAGLAAWIPASKEPLKLGMVMITARLTVKRGPGEQTLAPESDEPSRVQVTRMKRPESH